MLSKKLVEALKLSSVPQYKIANKANVHPSTLSKWIIGAQSVRDGDERVIRIGKILGLNESEIFEEDQLCR